jgi:peptidoglycan/xylan/chitin deacetylase (PgdA/CDA1 family)
VGRGLIALAVVVAVAGSTAVAGSDVGAGYPIYCGGHKGRYLALTFDDGPGAHNATVDSAARSLGLKEILWSVDSYDSRGYSTAEIAHTVLKLVQPGAIILLHDVIPNTLAALPRILRILEARKFQLVTVSELLKRDPPSLRQLRQGFQGCYAARASD